MGAHESKSIVQGILPYKDAAGSRLDNEEVQMLQNSANASSSGSSQLVNKGIFIRDVLVGVPTVLHERLYEVFGGTTRGITVPDMISGISILLKGTVTERKRLVFAVYDNDNSGFVTERSMLAMLLPGEDGECIVETFRYIDTMNFEQFDKWVTQNSGATGLTQWIMYKPKSHFRESIVPSEIEVLAEISHLTKQEALVLKQRYDHLRFRPFRSGHHHHKRLSASALRTVACPPLPLAILSRLCFLWGDASSGGDNDSNISFIGTELVFREVLMGVSTICRGTTKDLCPLVVKLFDVDGKGHLDAQDVACMLNVLDDTRSDCSSQRRERNASGAYSRTRTLSACSVTSKDDFEGSDDSSDSATDIGDDSNDDGMEPMPPGASPFAAYRAGGSRTDAQTSVHDKRGHGEHRRLVAPHDERVAAVLSCAHNERDERQCDAPASADNGLVGGTATTGKIGAAGLQRWVAQDGKKALRPLLDALALFGHTVFALRPHDAKHEGRLVMQRMKLDDALGVTRTEGNTCYLINAAWFRRWQVFVGLDQPAGDDVDETRTTVGGASPPTQGIPAGGRGSVRPSPTAYKKSPLGTSAGVSGESSTATPVGLEPIDNHVLFGSGGSPGRAGMLVGAVLGGVAPTGSPKRTSSHATTLRKELAVDRDFVVVSEVVWSMLHHWYDGGPKAALPVMSADGVVGVELYPLNLRVVHHGPIKGTGPSAEGTSPRRDRDGVPTKVPAPSLLLSVECSRTYTMHQLARRICAQQKSLKKGNPRIKADAVRLWLYSDPTQPVLLDENARAYDLSDGATLLLEVRNADLSWPSELFALGSHGNKHGKKALATVLRTNLANEPGVTGLSNLGNTCYLNAGIQCLSHIPALKEYFLRQCYRAEINKTNVMGSKGAVASQYGQLVQRLWRGKASVFAPSALRDTVVRHASQFAGFEQHDSQEFLNYMLDALHEDVNRVRNPPYVERKDSAGRPDHVVAAESWRAHMRRNQSIIVDLFQGQLKSTLRCKTCRFESVSFDPFTFLQLPLPSEAETVLNVRIVRSAPGCSAVPELCAVHVAQDGRVGAAVPKVAALYGVDPRTLTIVEFPGTPAQRVVRLEDKIRALKSPVLHMYEVDVPAAAESETAPAPAAAPSTSPAPTATPTARPVAPPKSVQQYDVPGHIFAIHRRRESYERHFLTQPTRVAVFGHALLIPCPAGCTTAALYDAVWARVKRCCRVDLRRSVDAGTEDLPFALTQLSRTGTTCHPSKCGWGRFCIGCVLPRSDAPFNPATADLLGIDWKARPLCLHFDSAEEQRFTNHTSIADVRAKENEPIDLHDCLRAFTREEDMGKDEAWYCPKCKSHQQCTKKLDIWSLPPVLIIHLKRFQMVNSSWIKSQRHVSFPLEGFNVFEHLPPPRFVAATPSVSTDDNGGAGVSTEFAATETTDMETTTTKTTIAPETTLTATKTTSTAEVTTETVAEDILATETTATELIEAVAEEITAEIVEETIIAPAEEIKETDPKETTTTEIPTADTTADANANDSAPQGAPTVAIGAPCATTRARNACGMDDAAEDAATHPTESAGDTARGIPDIEKLDPHSAFYTNPAGARLYDVCGMTIHLGIMGGGHYVAYGKNADKWYCFNDSSCKEVPAELVAREHAYCLFYTARGLDLERFLPDKSSSSRASSRASSPGVDNASDNESDDDESSKLGGKGTANHCCVS
eukprot:m.1359378 g.1359378  ORF g.1359378 m.1359378 type:complete len:1699 (-) comp24937_c0_seq24:128-5224(-)